MKDHFESRSTASLFLGRWSCALRSLRLPPLLLLVAPLLLAAPASAASVLDGVPAGLPFARAAGVANVADPGRPSLVADLGAYLAGADLLYSWDATRYDELAPVRWFQSAYVGNGLLGAMVTAVLDPSTNATSALRVDVSRTDVWACHQRAPTAYVTLRPAGGAAFSHVDMRLDLLTARLRVNASLVGGGGLAFSLFVNAADPLGATGVLALVAEGGGSSGVGGFGGVGDVGGVGGGGGGGAQPLTIDVTPDSSERCSDKAPATGQAPAPWGGSAAISFATQNFTDGTVTAAWSQFSDGASGGQQALLLAVANSQRSALNQTASLGDALAAVADAHAASLAGLASAHAAWWSAFWSGTSFFSFDSAGGRAGVTKLEQFAHIAGYRYASAARFTMHDLMGPWGPAHINVNGTECVGPWCKFVWDMNQEVMTYLPTPSNRGALLGKPAFDMLPAALDGSWDDVYGSNGPGGGESAVWWTAQAWRYCAFHGDDTRLLGSVLPALGLFLSQGSLRNGTDGLLHLYNCTSPEYKMRPSTDCNFGLSVYKWAAQTGLAIAAELAPDDPNATVFRDVLARIAPFPVDAATGSWSVAADLPYAMPHRHYSHLLMMFDLDIVGGNAGDADTMRASLDVFFNVTCAGPQAHGPDWDSDGECRGFTQAALSAMSALMNRSDAALGNLTKFIELVGLPNAMYGEMSFVNGGFSPVSESAYSAAASVYGLLLRSAPWPPVPRSGAASSPVRPLLHVFPAAPFANASFFRLRAEGALLVSAERAGGATQWAAVEADLLADGSGAGAPVAFLLFVADWLNVTALAIAAAPGVAATLLQPGLFAVTGLTRGSAAGFYPAGAAPFAQPPLFAVGVAQGRNASEANSWGSRFVFEGEFCGTRRAVGSQPLPCAPSAAPQAR